MHCSRSWVHFAGRECQASLTARCRLDMQQWQACRHCGLQQTQVEIVNIIMQQYCKLRHNNILITCSRTVGVRMSAARPAETKRSVSSNFARSSAANSSRLPHRVDFNTLSTALKQNNDLSL